jgi:hypothetical protein
VRGKKRPSGLKVSCLTVLSAQFSTRSTKFLMVLKLFQFLVLHLGLSSDATYKGAADNQLSTVRACCPQFLLLQQERWPATRINFVGTTRYVASYLKVQKIKACARVHESSYLSICCISYSCFR